MVMRGLLLQICPSERCMSSSHFQQFSLLHIKAVLYVIIHYSLLYHFLINTFAVTDDTGSCEKQTIYHQKQDCSSFQCDEYL